ncbi:MAG: hypothetical protein WC606_02750 [Candidatus Absconditabacterales bacterium]|jgi:hypothetical protein
MKPKIYYKLDEILAAAKPFARTKDAQSSLEKHLRNIEAKKTNKPAQSITEISYESLREAILLLTVCYEELITAILVKFKLLGYKAIKRIVLSHPSLN